MTQVTKYHDEARPDRWLFELDGYHPNQFNAYELYLAEEVGGHVSALNGQEPQTDSPFWVLNGIKKGIRKHIHDFDSIHAGLDLLMSMGVITAVQKAAVEGEWTEAEESGQVSFEDVRGQLREARNMIEVLVEHLVHATATIGDIQKGRQMVKEIDKMDL